ncbi:hypothetical protein I4U23_004078 [Adineta vaga]|nr:hypothetical protein I4U23_004078 [Adineta vaga]
MIYQRLESSLNKCIDRYHNLRLNINSTVKPYHFYFIKQPYSTPLYLKFETQDEWKQIVDDELHNPFKLNDENLDVNLRHPYPSPFDRYEHVGLAIGVMILNDITISLQTKFWSLFHIIFDDLQKNISDGKHLTCLRVTRLSATDEQIDQQIKRNNDLNFSNIDSYPFQEEYENMKLKHYYCVGSNPCPCVATNVLLVCSIESLDYVLLHEAIEKNQIIANTWFNRMVNLTDIAWKYDQEWTFNDFFKENTK